MYNDIFGYFIKTCCDLASKTAKYLYVLVYLIHLYSLNIISTFNISRIHAICWRKNANC